MEDKQTLCWNCNTAYPMFYDTCPKCGATNANTDFNLAKAEIENPALIVSPKKASLIAAAPELLAALERIANAMPVDDRYDFYQAAMRYQEIARAAIAKATGSSHE